MLHPAKFADVLDTLKEMNKEQLRELAQTAEQRIDERRERFETLCAGFYDYLQQIMDEFPNSHVYLIHGNAEMFDLMDCLIPQNTWEVCEIGD